MPESFLDIALPPIPPLDSAGAPSRPAFWKVYINGEVAYSNLSVSVLSTRYPVESYGEYLVAVSLVNELGEGELSDTASITYEQPKGVPSKPGAPSVTMFIVSPSPGNGGGVGNQGVVGNLGPGPNDATLRAGYVPIGGVTRDTVTFQNIADGSGTYAAFGDTITWNNPVEGATRRYASFTSSN